MRTSKPLMMIVGAALVIATGASFAEDQVAKAIFTGALPSGKTITECVTALSSASSSDGSAILYVRQMDHKFDMSGKITFADNGTATYQPLAIFMDDGTQLRAPMQPFNFPTQKKGGRWLIEKQSGCGPIPPSRW